MFILHYKHCGLKHEITSETKEEILSIVMDCYNSGCELMDLFEDDKLLVDSVDLYKLIKKCYY